MVDRNEVLVVEDEQILAMMLASLLQEDGYEVTCVTSAEDALARINASETPYSAIVADVNLHSSLSGLDLAHMLKRQDAGAATIFMTGGSAKDVAAAAPAGSIVLEKPFRPTQVLDALDQLLKGD